MSMSEAKWDDGLPHPDISKDDIEGLKLPDIRAIGQLGAQDIEALLVGYLIHDPDETMPKEWEIQAADAILESGIKGSWFEDKQYGESFEVFLGRYKGKRQLITPEDAANLKRVGGMEREKADVFTSFLVGCLGAVLAWKVRADIVIKLKWNRHSWNVTNNLWKRFQHEYGNEAVGPEKAIENLRKDCTKELATPGQGIIKEHDWISDYESLTGWAKDMKTNPEKYRGCCCGISTIDERTNGGFRPGHLTVFVGRPGGYKTTMLLNIAHGLWNAGYDVLYVSLEMEAKLLELKFWCRATGELDYTKLFRGLISEPGDRQCLADVTTALTKADLNPEEKAKLESQKRKLEEILAGVQPGNEDSEILARFEQSS